MKRLAPSFAGVAGALFLLANLGLWAFHSLNGPREILRSTPLGLAADPRTAGETVEEAARSPWEDRLLAVVITRGDPAVQRIEHSGFQLAYFEPWEQARWTAHHLSSAMDFGRQKRTNDFRSDPAVNSGSAVAADYSLSGYDRGHLVPAQDLSWSAASMSQSFYFSNVSPQDPSLNRGPWRAVENEVRGLLDTASDLYVVTGPVMNPDAASIGNNRVAVPEFFFKAVLAHSKGGTPPWTAFCYLLPNSPQARSISDPVHSIDAIETLTGLDLYSALPDDLELRVEAQAWKWQGEKGPGR